MTDGTEMHDECKNCGAPLESSNVGPCPSCGERAGKNIYAAAMLAAHVEVSATGIVIKWDERYKVLLDTARRLRDEGYHAAAIAMAQTACEVCMETVLTEALLQRVGDDEVADLITGRRRNYNPKSEWVKKWYELLFGHPIQAERFWESLSKHVDRRHDVVHRGESATSQDADESIAAVDAAIQHLLKNRS